ncbi:histidine kinase [Spirosoma taeanense]|uniref:Histidine kinase n=1 Tax=Spirosoma taeanense TaxID=2735870 RepID=A0A6M5Y8P8_9BACT|nr:histidine kinase [Spirosoma taeanense]QJW90309.1 histidine kinase [Spirosoma taeanense]
MKPFVKNIVLFWRSLPSIRQQTKWHFALLFPWFIPLLTYWVVGPKYLTDGWTFVSSTLLNLSIAGCCLLTLDQLTQKVIRHYPGIGQTWPRVSWLLLVFILVTPFFILGPIALYSYFHLYGYQHDWSTTQLILVVNLGANVLSVGIDESVYSLNQWRENAIEREQLRKVNLQSQFESLKAQVNPHFLFNSLNSLSSLIADEPDKAEQFVDEMAKTYRYLLQTNEGELTTLATELGFIDSYYHLLKTRYRAGIDLTVDVPPHYRQHQLPPLTLQMLLENAVKHNVILAGRPLHISITTTDDGWLQVRNNLQRKTGRVASNQIGLTNIAAKYRLLAQADPIVSDDNGYFTVVLPLLAPLSVAK